MRSAYPTGGGVRLRRLTGSGALLRRRHGLEMPVARDA
jgi:hypothetical protein